jgi:outer membrane protein
MRKTITIYRLAMAAVLAIFTGFYPGPSAMAAGFIELDFENMPTIVGIGVGIMPDYAGSDDYTAGVAPFFRYTFQGQKRYVQLIANEFSINILNHEMFRFGPLLNYRFGRDDDVDDERVSRMEKIDDTIEAGAFLDIVWSDPGEKRKRFILGVKCLQDVGDESDGFRANLNARYWYPVAKPVDLNISAGAWYQDDDYSNHYFGVNAENVGTSGLPFFTADGGLNEYYAVVGANVYLSQNWVMSAGIRGSVITGDPGDSPLVEERGDSTQLIAGIGIGYIWW